MNPYIWSIFVNFNAYKITLLAHIGSETNGGPSCASARFWCENEGKLVMVCEIDSTNSVPSNQIKQDVFAKVHLCVISTRYMRDGVGTLDGMESIWILNKNTCGLTGLCYDLMGWEGNKLMVLLGGWNMSFACTVLYLTCLVLWSSQGPSFHVPCKNERILKINLALKYSNREI